MKYLLSVEVEVDRPIEEAKELFRLDCQMDMAQPLAVNGVYMKFYPETLDLSDQKG